MNAEELNEIDLDTNYSGQYKNNNVNNNLNNEFNSETFQHQVG